MVKRAKLYFSVLLGDVAGEETFVLGVVLSGVEFALPMTTEVRVDHRLGGEVRL